MLPDAAVAEQAWQTGGLGREGTRWLERDTLLKARLDAVSVLLAAHMVCAWCVALLG